MEYHLHNACHKTAFEEYFWAIIIYFTKDFLIQIFFLPIYNDPPTSRKKKRNDKSGTFYKVLEFKPRSIYVDPKYLCATLFISLSSRQFFPIKTVVSNFA